MVRRPLLRSKDKKLSLVFQHAASTGLEAMADFRIVPPTPLGDSPEATVNNKHLSPGEPSSGTSNRSPSGHLFHWLTNREGDSGKCGPGLFWADTLAEGASDDNLKIT